MLTLNQESRQYEGNELPRPSRFALSECSSSRIHLSCSLLPVLSAYNNTTTTYIYTTMMMMIIGYFKCQDLYNIQ